MKLTHFGTDTYTVFAFLSPDKKCRLLSDTPTIRSLLFSVKARNSTNGLFLSLEIASKQMEQGGFVISYLKRHETEAIEKLSNLSAFFWHRFGENSLEHFTQEAVNQAEQTLWDKEMDRPISLEEQYLEEIADEDIEWIENLADVKFTSDLQVAVVLERPKLAQVPQPVLPENADADTVKTFFPNQAVPQAQPMDHDSEASAKDGNGQASPTPEAQSAGVSSEASAPGA
jgi:hypothetical protein